MEDGRREEISDNFSDEKVSPPSLKLGYYFL
jgi:hypothetical protein